MAGISDNLTLLMQKVKLEKLGIDFKDQAVGNREPWKVVEQGSDYTKITLRLSEHWRQRKQSKQGPSASGPIRSVWDLGLPGRMEACARAWALPAAWDPVRTLA